VHFDESKNVNVPPAAATDTHLQRPEGALKDLGKAHWQPARKSEGGPGTGKAKGKSKGKGKQAARGKGKGKKGKKSKQNK